ncbi:MAG: RNA polymerase sigma factor [Vicinamibacterales bacterium]
MTFIDVERLSALEEAERTFLMDEEAFREFYELTARPVWVYLVRMTGDSRLADDLLQECYYRILRTRASFESIDHRRNYLFRIATNLVRDHRRRPRIDQTSIVHHDQDPALRVETDTADRVASRLDLARAMEQLRPRERNLLWLAYAQGFSHEEIAASLGVKAASLKALLFRARRRLLTLMGPRPSRGRV